MQKVFSILSAQLAAVHHLLCFVDGVIHLFLEGLHLYTSAYVSIRQHTSAYASSTSSLKASIYITHAHIHTRPPINRYTIIRGNTGSITTDTKNPQQQQQLQQPKTHRHTDRDFEAFFFVGDTDVPGTHTLFSSSFRASRPHTRVA